MGTEKDLELDVWADVILVMFGFVLWLLGVYKIVTWLGYDCVVFAVVGLGIIPVWLVAWSIFHKIRRALLGEDKDV